MRLYPHQSVVVHDKFSPADPRVRDLDRATARAYADLGEAIETAVLRGVPVEVIARYTNLPMDEVRLAAADAWEATTLN